LIELRRILVPTDFSKFSQVALAYAAALAEKFGAELYLLHVVQDLTVFLPEAVETAPAVALPVDQFLAAARTAMERSARDSSLKDLPVHQEVRVGTPFYEIVRFAREGKMDLIVMGTHGHTGLVHVLLGSVTEKVVRKAPCPVLTVRHPEHEFVHP
jgi:nucleotide-binding universal stress UspA family protein